VNGNPTTQLVLVSLAAMLSPTTLTFCVLSLVLAQRPLRTGFWFYLGAITATLGVGVLAAFVLGDDFASNTSTPKTWVSILDIVLGAFVLGYVAHLLRRPVDNRRTEQAVAQVSKVVSSRAIAVVAAGATLANPGMFIPIALKAISELDPSAAEYVRDWVLFAVVSLLPMLCALILLLIVPRFTERWLERARSFLTLHARQIAAAIVILLAASLIGNGIAGLTS
jgi:threonine/homoserine/homoserine lactone efflux protein